MGAFVPPVREGGFFIGDEEFKELIAQGTEVTVKEVERRVSTFGKGPNGEDLFQYVVTVDLDGEERGKSFNEGVNSRDALLAELKYYLENEPDPEPVVVTFDKVKSQSGRPVNIVKVVGADEAE